MLLPAQETKIALVRLYSRLEFELEPGQVPLQVRERRLWGLSQRKECEGCLQVPYPGSVSSLQVAYGITANPKNGVWVRPRVRPMLA